MASLDFLFLLVAFCLKTVTVQSEFFFYLNEEGKYLPAFIDEMEQKSFFEEPLPQELEKHVRFLLYTRESQNAPEELTLDDIGTISRSKFNGTLLTKIIIHGFTHSDKVGFPPAARLAFLNPSVGSLGRPVNLIIVEWGKLCQAPWYSTAARNTRVVGVKLSKFIKFLVTEQYTPLHRIQIIGHSLGSHVAGFAGKELSEINMTLSRITALDPALPFFQEVSDENRIDPSDAYFVDVIHSAGGESSSAPQPQYKFLSSTRIPLAFIEPRGHADFFANGGRKQPGCGVDLFTACSHLRAYEYYLESVANSNGFPSCKCEDWETYENGKCQCSSPVYMGEDCSSSAKGSFFFKTGSKKPYATQSSITSQ